MHPLWTHPLPRKAVPFTLLLLLLTLLSATGQAAPLSTEVGGPIFADTTWTQADSPHIVIESVLIMNGATLTIEPGAEVRFDKGRALTVQDGTLIAKGTAADPIVFTSNSAFPQPGDWGFIFFDDNSTDATFSGGGYAGGSVLQHVVVEYAGPASDQGYNYTIGAVRVRNAAPFVDNAIVRHSGSSGIAVECGPSMRIANSAVTDNGWSGIAVYNYWTNTDCRLPVYITDNTIARNGSITTGYYPGLYVYSAGGQVTGNVVEDNLNTGIDATEAGSQTLPQTILDGNIVRRNGPTTYHYASGVNAYGLKFTNNEVYANEGLGIYVHGGGELLNNIVAYNTSGGLEVNCYSPATISHNKIAENSTREAGAGISANNCLGSLTISHNSIVFNHAKLGKSAIDLEAGSCGYDASGPTCRINHNTITGQTVETAGAAGGVYVGGGWNSSGDSPTEIRFNNLYGNANYDLHNGYPQNATAPLDARGNWWGTTNVIDIIKQIYDFIDNSSLASTNIADPEPAPHVDAPPAPPTGLTVSFSGDTFTLKWKANTEFDVNGYKVYYDTDGGHPYEGTGADQGNAGIDATFVTSFDLTGLPPANKYHFTVTAYDNDGNESWYAREVVYYVPKPINLIAHAGTKNIALAWNPTSVADVSHYRLTRSPEGANNFQPIGGDLADTFYFDEDPALTKGSSYCYKVTAMRAGGEAVITSNTVCTAFGQLSLWVPGSVGVPGEEVIVPINVRNADGLRIESSDIWLDFDPRVLAVSAVERTALTADYTWVHAVHNIDADTDRVKIAYIHGNAGQLPPELHGDGSLFWITFEVKGADGDTSPLDLQDFIQGVGGSVVKNEEAADVPLDLTNGTFKVVAQIVGAYSRGDVDGNGVVQAADAALALRLAAGERAATLDEVRAGDINGNGAIQAADASMILYYAAHNTWPPLPGGGGGGDGMRSVRAAAAQTTFYLDNASGRPGSTVETRLRGLDLQNVAGGEFVVVYDPSIVARTAVQKTSLTQGFDLRFEDDGAGQLRFALADDTPISGDGELATIRLTLVTTDTRGASAPLLLADARLNDRNGRDFVTGFPDNSIVRQSGQVSLSLIQLSPTGLTFSAKQGESNPPAQSLTVDLGGAAENWTASSDQAWLSVSPTSGNGDGSVEVSVDMATLPAGIHNGQVTIAVGEETSTSTVVFTVEDPAAALDVSPASLSFNATLGDANPAAQSLTVDLAGAAVAWTAAADQNWIGVSPASGNGNGSVSVSVDATGLSAGTHNGQVTITAGDQTRTSAVTLTIDDPNATLQVSPGSLSFSATAGGNNPGSQTLTIDPGDAGTGWSATASQPWLSIAPASGTGPGSASVSVNIDGLSTGSHNAQIQVTAGDQTVNRSVTLTVLDPGQETKVFLPAVIR